MQKYRPTREQFWERIRSRTEPWDLIVIGGGATGVGVALDAASRKLDVLLLEQSDFGKGTSSRSTKLIHGGVRYLKQGNISLVRSALHERARLQQNAPHVVRDLAFLIPCRNIGERLFYLAGLKMYDALAGRDDFGSSRAVSRQTAAGLIPVLDPQQHSGGVIYHDGQFDDARLLINMAQTAVEQGGVLLNYAPVSRLLKGAGDRITGVVAHDAESQATFEITGRCVVNAAGPFCDTVRRFDDPQTTPLIAPSQGVHLVIPRELYPGETALIVPKTSDGRVLFIIPWQRCVLIGTTDTPIPESTLEPVPQAAEIEFLMRTANHYLTRPLQPEDILSLFTGIRPLVKGGSGVSSARLSRDHYLEVSRSGLLTITGGKWTTVRKMAEDCVNRAISIGGLAAAPCRTHTLRLHAAPVPGTKVATTYDHRGLYGTDQNLLVELEQAQPHLAVPYNAALDLTPSEVAWAARHEFARTLEDVLCRRSRALVHNAAATLAIAPAVAADLATELGQNAQWIDEQVTAFHSVAQPALPN